ncbi:hypothetical protein MMC12_001058 [Toensbergia leucococca]|nr:hypothetical protein [Toensbergia leucococca]
MPNRDSPSPVRRPSLNERSSSQSVMRASPSAPLHSPSHKGPHRPHKVHTVSHSRLPHNRNTSYGKGLNKLSKLTQVPDNNGPDSPKIGTSTSPMLHNIKRNTSATVLPRTSSKVSMKKNLSSLSLKPNTSTTALPRISSDGSIKRNKSNLPLKRNGSSNQLTNGKQKAPLHRSHLSHDSTDQVLSNQKVRFSTGDDVHDDEWAEESGSQSPDTTRQNVTAPKMPRADGSPPMHMPLEPSPENSPASSSHSPPQSDSRRSNLEPTYHQGSYSSHDPSNFPDADAVTYRLLNHRASSKIEPLMSSVSASVDPSISRGSPSFYTRQEPNLNSDPSMTSDGISRFLNPTGSSSGSATPGSISQLHSTLAHIHHNQRHRQEHASRSPVSSSVNDNLDLSRRAKPTGNVSNSRAVNSGEHLDSPPQAGTPGYARVASPYESALDRREGGLSRTQLKLDLQRMSSNREPAHAPAVSPPLIMMHGANAVSTMGEKSAERRVRQWEQAGLEFWNGRRYNNLVALGIGRVHGKERGKRAHKSGERERDGGEETSGTSPSVGSIPSAASSPRSRGRVRFEVGGDEDNFEVDGLDDMMRRLWDGDGSTMVE